MSEPKYIRVEDAVKASAHPYWKAAVQRLPTYTPANILAGMWVPVTPDTLPDLTVPVFALKDGKVHKTQRCIAGSWVSLEAADLEQYGRYWVSGPTHWMPLPSTEGLNEIF